MSIPHPTPQEINVPDRLPIPPEHRRGVHDVKLDVEQIRWMLRATRRAAFERAIEVVRGIKSYQERNDSIIEKCAQALETEMNNAK